MLPQPTIDTRPEHIRALVPFQTALLTSWGNGVVYAMHCPETRAIMYVGYTRCEMGQRMATHWGSRKKKDSPVARWLDSLDKMPPVSILAEGVMNLYQAEREAIETYGPPLNRNSAKSPRFKMLRAMEAEILNYLESRHG